MACALQCQSCSRACQILPAGNPLRLLGGKGNRDRGDVCVAVNLLLVPRLICLVNVLLRRGDGGGEVLAILVDPLRLGDLAGVVRLGTDADGGEVLLLGGQAVLQPRPHLIEVGVELRSRLLRSLKPHPDGLGAPPPRHGEVVCEVGSCLVARIPLPPPCGGLQVVCVLIVPFNHNLALHVPVHRNLPRRKHGLALEIGVELPGRSSSALLAGAVAGLGVRSRGRHCEEFSPPLDVPDRHHCQARRTEHCQGSSQEHH
mmetsp:Transcript_1524/g.3661  ORF Transcript_1524/g.3661 Transcript_1524/m.3661 type:complete len:258 (-) Transcript_1524:71-844(-)